MRATLALLLLVSSIAHAGVYTWTDEQGRKHFGDKPPAQTQATEVKIRSFNAPAEVTSNTGGSGVVLLTTTWCGVCKQAKRYLDGKGIAYAEHDVEKSETGRSEYKRLGGRGVPIVLVGDQRMDGFSPARLEPMLRAAGLTPQN